MEGLYPIKSEDKFTQSIPVSDHPSAPCLATRLPYGAEIDLELLGRIDEAETYIRSLGYRNIRLRVHDTIVRLEIDLPDLKRLLKDRAAVVAYLKKLGFRYITMDLEGFRSGSMDDGFVNV